MHATGNARRARPPARVIAHRGRTPPARAAQRALQHKVFGTVTSGSPRARARERGGNALIVPLGASRTDNAPGKRIICRRRRRRRAERGVASTRAYVESAANVSIERPRTGDANCRLARN